MANNNHFDLQLDTLAPSGSITRPGQFINANDNLVIVVFFCSYFFIKCFVKANNNLNGK